MGYQEKHEVETAEISLRSLSRPPIKTKTTKKGDNEKGEETSTPTRKAKKLVCPQAPKKAKPALLCRVEGVEFFSVPDDLESVFIRREERAM